MLPSPQSYGGDHLPWSIEPNFNFSSVATAIWGEDGKKEEWEGELLKTVLLWFLCAWRSKWCCFHFGQGQIWCEQGCKWASQWRKPTVGHICANSSLFVFARGKKILISISLNWVGEHYQLEGPFWFDRPHCMMINYFSASLDFSNFLLPLAGGSAR